VIPPVTLRHPAYYNLLLLLLPDLEDKDKFEVKEVKDKAVIRGHLHYLIK